MTAQAKIRRRSSVPLVIEDNLIIAMDVEEALREMGFAPAHIGGSVEYALQILKTCDVAFAVLDFHLGHGETCEPIAEALSKNATPFIFVSGYDVHARLTERFPAAPVIAKPYLPSDVAAALRQIGVYPEE